jgi:hypothetical protein
MAPSIPVTMSNLLETKASSTTTTTFNCSPLISTPKTSFSMLPVASSVTVSSNSQVKLMTTNLPANKLLVSKVLPQTSSTSQTHLLQPQKQQFTLNIVSSAAKPIAVDGSPIKPQHFVSGSNFKEIITPSLPPEVLKQIKAGMIGGANLERGGVPLNQNFQLPPGITSIKQPLPASVVNISKYKCIPSPLISVSPGKGSSLAALSQTGNTGIAVSTGIAGNTGIAGSKLPGYVNQSVNATAPISRQLVLSSQSLGQTKLTTVLSSALPSIPSPSSLSTADPMLVTSQSVGRPSITLVKTAGGEILTNAGSTLVAGKLTPNVNPFQR